jgi:hypothetical protein
MNGAFQQLAGRAAQLAQHHTRLPRNSKLLCLLPPGELAKVTQGLADIVGKWALLGTPSCKLLEAGAPGWPLLAFSSSQVHW